MNVQGIEKYIGEIDKIYRAGNATEHSYRPALQKLLETLTEGLVITNEPKRIACGAPDYIATRNGIPAGYIEAKDIPVGIHNKANEKQFQRYKRSLNNLIITDYLNFELFLDGELIAEVSVASVSKTGIKANPAQFGAFLTLLEKFAGYAGNSITASDQLAHKMADKAKLLAEVITTALADKTAKDDALAMQLKAFQNVLIHNLDDSDFADMYAQTLAYGLFAARLNQRDGEPFTREKAALLIPHSNPFLRKFFQFIAGFDLDVRIAWIVDALADVFNCVSVTDILREFENANQDPYIHFYEMFLAEYNPALRESRGVYYTPDPVVKFIVQAVDDILQKDFSLPQGLADCSKITRTLEKDGKKEKIELHKVQILDPAAGTGTFLAEVIEKIYRRFANQKGMWQSYCAEHLIPRLNGFEILMASYAMAHFKLDMKLKETGYTAEDAARLRVYLTNTLEEPPAAPILLMEKWLADEANEANTVKRDAPVMVVLGNPPYSGESANRTAEDFLSAYKKEPGGAEKLREKNPKWLNDDYVKFIRYGQNCIEKLGEGVLAYITNHGFLDNPTFRGMRWNLLQTFDAIYVLDLHGNAKKKETAPDGGKDENVFDIQQGVSITILVKLSADCADNADNTLAPVRGDYAGNVYHYDLYGTREVKYQFLRENTIATVPWKKLQPEPPQYFFAPKNFSGKDEYEKGFSVTELFPVNGVGITTAHDDFVISEDFDGLLSKFETFKNSPGEASLLREKFQVIDKAGWDILAGWKNIQKSEDLKSYIHAISYRPFDKRFIFYEDKLVWRTVRKIMRHFIAGDNVGLVFRRQQLDTRQTYYFITNKIIADGFIRSDNKGGESVAPLYLYEDGKRSNNLNKTIVQKVSLCAGLCFPVEIDGDEYQGLYTIDGTPKENRASIQKWMKHELKSRALSYTIKGEPVRFGSRSVTVFTSLGMSNPVYMKCAVHFRTLLDFALPLQEEIPLKTNPHYQKYIYLRVMFSMDSEIFFGYFIFGKNDGEWHFVRFDIEKEPPLVIRSTNASQETENSEVRLTGTRDPNAGHQSADKPPKAALNTPQKKRGSKKQALETFNSKYTAIPNNSQAESARNCGFFSPLDLLDYIYAVLHSPAYRERYREFLKIDFPRIPYPANAEGFRALAGYGGALRKLHLLEGVEPSPDLARYPVAGSNTVDKPEYKNSDGGIGAVWINKTQYFDNVPAEAWEFYVGGYQPAQKWLKDRKGETLGFGDIQHYQKIIRTLAETIAVQCEIDGAF